MKETIYLELVDRLENFVWQQQLSFIPNILVGETINVDALSADGKRESPNEYRTCEVLKVEHNFEFNRENVFYRITLLVKVTNQSE